MSQNVLSVQDFVEQIKAFLIANQDRVSDFNTGSTLDTQIQAFAVQLNQVQIKALGSFKRQFEQIPFQAFSFQRKETGTASGTVVFSRQTATATQVNIPIGTVVSTSTGLLYTTQDAVSILAGETDSGPANIIAEKSGADYNALINKVNLLVSSVTGINSVTNNTACSGGKDEETNSEYYARFANFILGLQGSNTYGIFTASTTVEGIQSAYVENHFPPLAGYTNFTVYVDDGSGNVPQSKLDEVDLKVRGNNTAEYQGYVGAGINFRVLSAGLVNVAVVYEVKINPATTDATALTTAINDAIQNYINNLWVGSDVIWSEVNKLIQQITGVLSVTELTLNGIEDDVITTASQVPRVSSISSGITT